MDDEAVALALTLIQRFEGLRLEAYVDASGIPTIGYGHTAGVRMRDKITAEQAMAYLRADLTVAIASVTRLVTVPLTPPQEAALLSFVFNVGGKALATSTLLKLLNEGRYDSVPAQLHRWVYGHGGKKLPGLIKRRAAEAILWKGVK